MYNRLFQIQEKDLLKIKENKRDSEGGERNKDNENEWLLI